MITLKTWWLEWLRRQVDKLDPPDLMDAMTARWRLSPVPLYRITAR